MAFVPVYGFNASITAATAAGAGLIELDPNVAASLAASLGSNFTYASLSDGVNYEVIRIVSVSGSNVTVIRGLDGTPTSDFPSGSCVRFIWTTEGIEAIAAGSIFTLTGTGAAAVTPTGPNSWNINVPVTTIGSTLPAQVLGAFPNFEVAFQATNGGCCCGGGGGGGGSGTVTAVTGTGLAVASGGPAIYNIAVTAPNFVGADGVTITGSWPNITIHGAGIPTSGTVQSVTGSTKILIAGTPTVNPVIQLQTTPAGAQTYNGVTIDAYGTVTAVDPLYIPATLITSANANCVVTNPGPGHWDLNVTVPTVVDATTSVKGIVQLAPATAVGSNDPSDAVKAVTPAGINAVLATLPAPTPATTVSGLSNFTAAAVGTYTNVVVGVSVTLNLTGSQKALVRANVTATDSATAVPPNWGLAVLNGASLVQGIVPIWTGNHEIEFILSAPFSGTLSLATTALTGTTSIVGKSISAVVVP